MQSSMFQPTKDLLFSYFENSAHWSMKNHHYHNGYEIYIQTKGTREIFIENKSYLLKPGTVYIVTPHVLHSTRNTVEGVSYSRYIINFTSNILHTFLTDNEEEELKKKLRPCIMQLNESQTQKIIDLYNTMSGYWHAHLKGNPRGKKLAYMSVYMLVDYLISLMDNEKDLEKLYNVEVLSDSDIYKVLYYISTHYSEDITLNDMVKLSHMSVAGFYRAFKKATGDTFSHYLNQYRAVMAHKLLIQTTLSLKQIALKCGFPSTAHFTRVFKEIHGISPSKYRKL